MRFIYTHPRRPEVIVFGEGRLVRWDVSKRPRVLADYAWLSAKFNPSLAVAVGPDGLVLRPSPAWPKDVSRRGVVELASWDEPTTGESIYLTRSSSLSYIGAFSGDGRLLALADDCEQLLLMDRVTGRVGSADTGAMATSGLIFSPDGRQIAAISTDQGGGYLGLWHYDPETLELVCTKVDRRGVPYGLEGDLADTFGNLAFSPNSRLLAAVLTSAWWPTDLTLYDVATARLLWHLPLRAIPFAHNAWTSQVLFTPDGTGLVHGSPATGLVVRSIGDGTSIQQIPWPARQEISWPANEQYFVLASDPLLRGVWTVDAKGVPVLLPITGLGFRSAPF